jgi:hypothetical protein
MPQHQLGIVVVCNSDGTPVKQRVTMPMLQWRHIPQHLYDMASFVNSSPPWTDFIIEES